MERSAAAAAAFVKWEEVFSTNDRGRKEVRYYLKRRDGTSDLAVVGKEKSLGRDSKTTASYSYRYRYAIRDKSVLASVNSPVDISSKLRSRREVIDWLSSLVTDCSFSLPPKPSLKFKLKNLQGANLHKTSQHTPEIDPKSTEIRPRKRLRRLVDTENLSENIVKIGSEIEVLSQDSGIRGLWFKAVVIKKHKDKIKVRYQDIKDAEDESVNLEEWILSSKVAAIDQLGIRHSGRLTIRPFRLTKSPNFPLIEVGCIVDAWLHDGWWEGIVVHKESDDKIHVYFPGEKEKSILGCKDLRCSEEWLGNQWLQMKNRQDLIRSISTIESNSQNTKSSKSLDNNVYTLTSGPKESLLPENAKDFEALQPHRSKEDILANLKWNWSKKKRQRKSSSTENNNNISIKSKRAKKEDGYFMKSSLKVDRENCKFINAPASRFCRSVASPLTNLVMSR